MSKLQQAVNVYIAETKTDDQRRIKEQRRITENRQFITCLIGLCCLILILAICY